MPAWSAGCTPASPRLSPRRNRRRRRCDGSAAPHLRLSYGAEQVPRIRRGDWFTGDVFIDGVAVCESSRVLAGFNSVSGLTPGRCRAGPESGGARCGGARGRRRRRRLGGLRLTRCCRRSRCARHGCLERAASAPALDTRNRKGRTQRRLLGRRCCVREAGCARPADGRNRQLSDGCLADLHRPHRRCSVHRRRAVCARPSR
jgi:hypothetical protein